MKAVHINPFLNATVNLFENLTGQKPDVGIKSLVPNLISHRWDVSGVIGVTGASEGVIAVRLPLSLVEKILVLSGIECSDEDECMTMTTSMVGEIANIIAGNALNDIVQYNLDITVPIVVQGKNHTISWPAKNPVIAIPFRTSYGPFEVNVSLKDELLV